MDRTHAEPRGYLAATQTPDHVIRGRKDYIIK